MANTNFNYSSNGSYFAAILVNNQTWWQQYNTVAPRLSLQEYTSIAALFCVLWTVI